MKYVNKRQLFFFLGFLLIVACTFSKVYGQTIEVVSQDTFSTAKPPKSISVKLLEPLVISENETYQAGSVLKGKLTEVISPKRLKKDAGFSFKPESYVDIDGRSCKLKSNIIAKYTEPIDKGQVAKNVSLGVGNYFVKGLSMGVAAVTGAVKNEEDNRLKSSATAVYEASPLSLAKKGEDLYINKEEHFFLKIITNSKSLNKDNKIKEQNNSGITEKE